MPVTDPYFRFPLGALSWGGSAIQALAAIIDYSVVSAGIAAEKGNPEMFAMFSMSVELPDPPQGDQPDEMAWYQYVGIGAEMTRTTVPKWRKALKAYLQVSQYIEANFPRSALVTIKAPWVLDALNTAWETAGLPGSSNRTGWITWREFRVLCAVLSVIGEKPYAWISTATLRHRVCGYTSAISMQGQEPPPHCPRLTRWMLEATLARLEELNFFLRVRVSGSPTGRGGRTAYSIRHEKREDLVKLLCTPRYASSAARRNEDHLLLKKHQQDPPAMATSPQPPTRPSSRRAVPLATGRSAPRSSMHPSPPSSGPQGWPQH